MISLPCFAFVLLLTNGLALSLPDVGVRVSIDMSARMTE